MRGTLDVEWCLILIGTREILLMPSPQAQGDKKLWEFVWTLKTSEKKGSAPRGLVGLVG